MAILDEKDRLRRRRDHDMSGACSFPPGSKPIAAQEMIASIPTARTA